MIHVLSEVPGLTALFTTRQGGLSSEPYASRNLGFFAGDAETVVAENWRLTLAEAGLAHKTPVLPRLVHGSDCAWIESLTPEMRGGFRVMAPDASDAVASQRTDVILSVTMADCMGILIADPTTLCIAAVHAGWRGTRDLIVAKTLRRLFSEGRARPESTWVCLGPALSAPRLGLSEAILADMDARYVHAIRTEDAGLGETFGPRPGTRGLDMRAWNRDQALAAGVSREHIEAIDACTYDQPELFFSYRRDGARSGRMAALIAWA